jgi:hypothetical protein
MPPLIPGPPPTHAVRLDGTALFITHRRIEFGPFDYDWSPDLRSLDLTYQGRKYGEVWSAEQLAVDLREFRLPSRVVQVAMLVTGCVLRSLQRGHSAAERQRLMVTVLDEFGCHRFARSLGSHEAA